MFESSLVRETELKKVIEGLENEVSKCKVKIESVLAAEKKLVLKEILVFRISFLTSF